MMEYLIANWYIGVVIVALLFGLVIGAYKAIKTPSNKQLEKVREWLLYTVMRAEQELGSGTGKLKLSYTFDLFVARFPLVAKLISFELFSMMVDEALEAMKAMLGSNKDARRLLEGEISK